MGYILCCVSLLLVNFAVGTCAGEQEVLSCGKVPEEFVKRVGTASDGPVSPVSGTTLTECSSTLKYTGGLSCCNAHMESTFLPASEDYLQDHIRISNKQLKDRITQSLHLFQKQLRLSVQEVRNRTSDTLVNLHKIPQHVHKSLISRFFNHLGTSLTGIDDFYLPQTVETFFRNLFPVVFNYVLSDPALAKHHGDDFDTCLIKSYDEVQPFGNIPRHLGKSVKHSLQRARMYIETLQVMMASLEAIENFTVPVDCRRAISRLHFCSLCSGQVELKPCRGLCLNVMRGCLSGISEISTSWDDLVVDFGNLRLGLAWANNGQELLYFEGNFTDALLTAMEDGPRIFTRVMALCRDKTRPTSERGMYQKVLTPEGLPFSHPGTRVQTIRKDITTLLVQLEESKGFLQRIADGLCRVPSIYDQEMRSDRCWNGSAVGRYMREVPEANVISQAKDNVEVKVMLIPDPLLLQVKDTLAHMKRNLSSLHNQDYMQGDQSYKTMVTSGGGYAAGRDVIIDDEDFAERNSGSGSGYGSEDDDDDRTDDDVRNHGDKPTHTSRPIGEPARGQGSFTPGSGGTGGGSRTGDGRDKGKGGPRFSATTKLMTSFSLLCFCAVLSRIKL